MTKKKLNVWYNEGLRFKCTECGQCCTGAPGYVWLTETDIKNLSEHLSLTREAFLKKYTRYVGSRYSLKEDSQNFDCIFLKGKKCTVYKARPKQCQKFPWWPSNLKSKNSWEDAARHCEGINSPDAPLISAIDIQNRLDE